MKRTLLLMAVFLTALGSAMAQETPRATALLPLETSTPTVSTRAAAPADLAADERIYSYCGGNDQLNGIGVGGHAHYQCAALFPGRTFESMVGNTVTAIRIKMNATNYQSNQHIWIRRSLTDEPIYLEDVVFNKPKEWQEFVLSTPFVLDGQDFYIGYDLEVSYDAQTQDEKFPIGCNLIPIPNSNFLNIDHYRWDDYMVDGFGALMIQAVIKGKAVNNDVALFDVKDINAVINEKIMIEGTFMNCTPEIVKDIDISYQFGDLKNSMHIDLEYAVRLMEASPFNFEVVMPNFSGKKEMVVTIDKVNGKADEFMDNNTCKGNINILGQQATRRVVLEEVTGTWCGYCIVGAASFERLHTDYPDNVICISAHGPTPTDDEFACGGYVPLLNQVSSYPRATLNRKGDLFHPYFGHTTEFYGVTKIIDEALAEFVPADVNVSDVKFIDNNTKLQMKGSATFYGDSPECPYQLAYAVLEDKLIGEQENILSGEGISDPYLEKYTKMGKRIRGFEFNDVARGIYPYEGVKGSLTGEIKSGVAKEHLYTVYLTQTTVENWDNCRLVVMLIDQRDGSIVNANQVSLKGLYKGTGIAATSADSTFEVKLLNGSELQVSAEGNAQVEVYTTSGALVTAEAFNGNTRLGLMGLQRGVYVVKVSNGSQQKTQKISL